MRKTSTKLEIACTLDPAGLEQRKGFLWNFVGRASGRRELGNGFEFSFDPASATFDELAQVVNLERNCCKFLRFVITIEPAGGPLRLEVTGADGAKEFLMSLFVPHPKSA